MHKPNQVIRFDWAIKHILRDKANFDILEGFLSAVLQEDVQVIQILESESDRDMGHLKYNRVDILVQDSEGRNVVIEVQNNHESDYLYRILFGTSKVIIDTLQIGKPYSEIVKVISISILYFNLGIGDDYVYYGSTQFVGLHTKEPLQLRQRDTDEDGKFYLRTVNIEREVFPEYYLIQVERFEDVINSSLDEWIYMLKNEEVRDDFTSRNIDRAREKLSVMQMSEEARRNYERYLMELASERDVMKTAHRKGRAEGIKEGEKRGRAEGVKKGRAEGIRETARNMLQMGFSLDQISQATGLSRPEIE
ncbi:PD-(D/E)XK nuclease family transposase [Anaerolineales bacterium HSG24]|nr:PD-(D/E)XK nuclease family transposase [Anaerolineales bacterium HSG24]